MRVSSILGAASAAAVMSLGLSACSGVNFEEITAGVPLSGLAEEAITSVSGQPIAVPEIAFVGSIKAQAAQATELAQLAIERSTNPEVIAVAEQIAAIQLPELDLVNDVLNLPGVQQVLDGLSVGEATAGVLNDEQVAALQNATGEQFDILFLEAMVKHREAATAAAEEMLGSANNEVVAIAEAVAGLGWPAVEELEALLRSLGG